MVKEDTVEEGDREECSKISTCKGIFLALQLNSHLIEGWIVNVYEYMKDTSINYSTRRNNCTSASLSMRVTPSQLEYEDVIVYNPQQSKKSLNLVELSISKMYFCFKFLNVG